MKKIEVYTRLLKYYKKNAFLIFVVFLLVVFSAFANIYGTFVLKDVINAITEASAQPLNGALYNAFMEKVMSLVYLYAAAVLAIVIYTQTVIRISQK